MPPMYADEQTPLGLLERDFDAHFSELWHQLQAIEELAPGVSTPCRQLAQTLMCVFVQLITKVWLPCVLCWRRIFTD